MTRHRTDKLKAHFYQNKDHPFQIFEKKVSSYLNSESTVVDAGCGSTAPGLIKFLGNAKKLIGVDLVEFDPFLQKQGLVLLNNDIAHMELPDSSVDLVISRSVLEHVNDVKGVYAEIYRILRPEGLFLFLVPNFLDYVSIFSYLVPNRFHKAIVGKLSGRLDDDVFSTYYKSNTRTSICKLADQTGFEVTSLQYYGQYPYMLEFNSLLFLIGMAYDKLITKFSFLKCLRGWILAELKKG